VASDSTLYVSVAGAGLFAGHAATLRWEPLSTPPGGNPNDDFELIEALTVHPRRPRLLYGVNDASLRLVRTDNGGATWTDLGRPGPSGDFGDLALDPGAPDALYLSRVNGEPGGCRSLKSTDRGATFRCLPIGQTIDWEVDPVDPRNVYSLNLRVAKSTDRGATWTAAGYNRGLPQAQFFPTQLVHAPGASGHLYLTDSKGRIFRTTDGGRNWKLAQGNLPIVPGFLSLAVDPRNPAVVYAAIQFSGSSGVYRSKNGGGRWQRLNRGLSGGLLGHRHRVPLAIDPRDPATVYVGTNSRGVFAITLTN